MYQQSLRASGPTADDTAFNTDVEFSSVRNNLMSQGEESEQMRLPPVTNDSERRAYGQFGKGYQTVSGN